MITRLSPFFPAMVVFIGAIFVAAGGFWAAYRQSNFNSEIRAKNDEIARLQREGLSSITGGDSFAFILFQVFAADGSAVNAFAMPDDLLLVPNVISQGKFPLYDVSVRFVRTGRGQSFDLNSAVQSYSWGNLTPGTVSTTAVRFKHHGKEINYNVFFGARNGMWVQELRMHWIGDGWALANRVRRGHEEIYNEVSQNYPRQSDGSIDWENGAPETIRSK